MKLNLPPVVWVLILLVVVIAVASFAFLRGRQRIVITPEIEKQMGEMYKPPPTTKSSPHGGQ
ncbi:MAG: hypothetical protein NZ805_07915 [Armatimonadetes bacterium]|nr:hypothetical protein [Armatimonadota bacterium]MDW8027377.1 hypothetical protein [Armatimonadota bacterium]